MDLAARMRNGVVLPAHPLALDESGDIDEVAQRAISRYHVAAGADGLAVGVHTTQFELHDDRGMLQYVWEMAASVAAEEGSEPILVAGITGDVEQAVAEAELAAELGYHAALMSPWGMDERTETTLLERAKAVGDVLPTIGFYLQDSVGGLRLGRSFWQKLFSLESVIAVKTAPFNRYRTSDVMQTLLHHDRWEEVAVLTGNDDAIIHDLITPYRITKDGLDREVRATGGLLGQWAVGTAAAVRYTNKANNAYIQGSIPTDLLNEASAMVEINAAVFDVANNFAGCVAGVNEMLRQQGLITSAKCLGRDTLSAGQSELISKVRKQYPALLDEVFVRENLACWLES